MEKTIEWIKYSEGENLNELTTYLSNELPKVDPSLIFASFAFVFDDKKRLLLTKLRKRGWDIPGGKLEEKDRNSENILEGLINNVKRETLEETKTIIKNLKLVAYRHIHNNNPYVPCPNYVFPYPDSYMVYFSAEIDSILEFKEEPQENGAIGRDFFEKEEAEKQETIFKKHPTIYKYAYELLK